MKKRMNAKKFLVVATLCAILTSSFGAMFAATPVYAADSGVTVQSVSETKSKSSKSERYFKDVKKKSLYRKEIEWLANKGAFKSIAKKNGMFKPTNTMTQGEFCKMLNNLYKDRIYLKAKKPKSKLTQAYATKTLTNVSDQLGYKITWSGGAPKATVNRSKASFYVYSMIKSANGQLDPS